MSDVTQILSAIEQGDPAASEELLPLVYQELRALAAAKLSHEKPGQTLQATALVHEAYLRLVSPDQVQQWDSRRHFFAAAAEAMRRILIEQARRKQRVKHGGDRQHVQLSEIMGPEGISQDEMVAVHEVLDELGKTDRQAGELVKLRYFAGFTQEEAAQILGISERTAYRDWSYARAWLRRKLDQDR